MNDRTREQAPWTLTTPIDRDRSSSESSDEKDRDSWKDRWG